MTQFPLWLQVHRLRSRVAVLETALARRSQELREIQRQACPDDLLVITRVLAGLSPRSFGPFDIESWHESVELEPAEAARTLTELWASTVPAWPRPDR